MKWPKNLSREQRKTAHFLGDSLLVGARGDIFRKLASREGTKTESFTEDWGGWVEGSIHIERKWACHAVQAMCHGVTGVNVELCTSGGLSNRLYHLCIIFRSPRI